MTTTMAMTRTTMEMAITMALLRTIFADISPLIQYEHAQRYPKLSTMGKLQENIKKLGIKEWKLQDAILEAHSNRGSALNN
jgi:hypothetical protein